MPNQRYSIIGLIPARGGSKGVPGKNIRLLGGKPLIVHTIEAAVQSHCFDRIYVSTDDPAIKKTSTISGIDIIDRPSELSADATSSQDVVRHAVETIDKDCCPENIVLLQPTSPFRNSRHIKECIELFFQSGCNSCISVTRASHHPYKSMIVSNGYLHPLFEPEMLHCPRQNLPEAFQQNGAIYIVKTDLFLTKNTFTIDPVVPYIMSQEESIDIDSVYDFTVAEFLFGNR